VRDYRTLGVDVSGQAVLKSAVHRLLMDLLGQLDAVGSRSKSKPLKLSGVFMVIGSVWLLQKYRFIPTDAFNGLLRTCVE